MEYSEKIVGFVDILGFANFVERSEHGNGFTPEELIGLQALLGNGIERDSFARYGPTICPTSPYQQKDLDFRTTQFSDSVVVSSETSPVAALNLVFHCWTVAMKLLRKGVMCRGYITRGTLIHSDSNMLGSGLHRAYEGEGKVNAFKRNADERGTPFIEVDQSVCDYLNGSGDACIIKMFRRVVKADGVVTAIFPFQSLERSVLIDANYDPARDLRENRELQWSIEKLSASVLKLIDVTNPRAVEKGEHYIAALDKQIQVCRDVESQITRLNSPFPRGRY